MGSTFARDLATMDGLSMQAAVEIHLTSNFYPPVPSSMAPICIQAINNYMSGYHNEPVELPKGITWKGDTIAPSWAIIEQHRLYPWIEDDSDVSAVPPPGDLQDAGVEDEPNL